MKAEKTKLELRRALRVKRTALSPAKQARAAEQLAANVTGTEFFQASQRVACYYPNDGEIDTRSIMERIWDLGKTCYLPVVPEARDGTLWFAPVQPDTPLSPNRVGIPEPVVVEDLFVRASMLDLVLLPLVGFDSNGNRLGMGGGYYDRSLAFLREQGDRRRPYLIGLAHDFQRVDQLPESPWDVPLDMVITDKAIY
ncbi:MAG: 5-formyltetrahydrofolate cyclo-ligase [Acidiferrobacterales bacterium]